MNADHAALVADLEARSTGRTDGWSRMVCPIHGTTDKNLAWTVEDGELKVKCHSHGCDRWAVVEALGFSRDAIYADGRYTNGKAGDPVPQPVDDPEASPRVTSTTEYVCLDAGGRKWTHTRIEYDSKPKDFRWQKGAPAKRCYYVPPGVSLAGAEVLVWAEGEGAAEAVALTGLPAVGLVGGVGSPPDPAVVAHIANLTGRTDTGHIIWPDKGDPKAPEWVGAIVAGLDGRPVRVIEPAADWADKDDAVNVLWPGMKTIALRDWAPGPEARAEAGKRMGAVLELARKWEAPRDPDDDLFTDTAGIYADVPDATWAIPYICFYGGLGLLAAVPKAGKTQLVFIAIAAGLHGKQFLGREVVFDRVIYMSEQGKATLKDQLSRAGIGVDTKSIDWLRKMDVLHLDWAQRVAMVERRIRRRYAGQRVLVVVDSLAEWIATGPGEENDSGAMRMGLEPLQHMAQETGAAVLAVLHAKFITADGTTPDGDVDLSPVRMVRGSTQMAGSADIITGLAKPPHRQGAGRRIRQIASEGRLDGLLDEGANIEWLDDGTYVLLDPGEDLEVNRAKRLIVTALQGKSGQSTDELVTATGISEPTIRRALEAMAGMAEMALDVTGKGVRNDPHRYWLPVKD